MGKGIVHHLFWIIGYAILVAIIGLLEWRLMKFLIVQFDHFTTLHVKEIINLILCIFFFIILMFVVVVPLYAFFGDCQNICKAITAGKQRNPSSELVIEEGQRTVVQEHLW
ncbi:hypothetical protein LIER_43185 [Lithospermum erythrorhizon]|uniref:Uncharacterized protein n=1 Tax=Lithospermum erythrorhizon TaxID=34254 RepID=A0AAV3PN22_LITER